MAASIKYFDTAKIAHCRLTTGVTATDGSAAATALTWYNTAPSGDWMLVKVIISSTGNAGTSDLADCLVHMFVDDGSTMRLVRTLDVGNQAAGTTALSAGQWEFTFGPEWVFPNTVLPEFTVSVTPTSGNVDIVVFAQAA